MAAKKKGVVGDAPREANIGGAPPVKFMGPHGAFRTPDRISIDLLAQQRGIIHCDGPMKVGDMVSIGPSGLPFVVESFEFDAKFGKAPTFKVKLAPVPANPFLQDKMEFKPKLIPDPPPPVYPYPPDPLTAKWGIRFLDSNGNLALEQHYTTPGMRDIKLHELINFPGTITALEQRIKQLEGDLEKASKPAARCGACARSLIAGEVCLCAKENTDTRKSLRDTIEQFRRDLALAREEQHRLTVANKAYQTSLENLTRDNKNQRDQAKQEMSIWVESLQQKDAEISELTRGHAIVNSKHREALEQIARSQATDRTLIEQLSALHTSVSAERDQAAQQLAARNVKDAQWRLRLRKLAGAAALALVSGGALAGAIHYHVGDQLAGFWEQHVYGSPTAWLAVFSALLIALVFTVVGKNWAERRHGRYGPTAPAQGEPFRSPAQPLRELRANMASSVAEGELGPANYFELAEASVRYAEGDPTKPYVFPIVV